MITHDKPSKLNDKDGISPALVCAQKICRLIILFLEKKGFYKNIYRAGVLLRYGALFAHKCLLLHNNKVNKKKKSLDKDDNADDDDDNDWKAIIAWNG